MYCEDDTASGGVVDINAPFAWYMLEAPFNDGLMKCLVPATTGLAHTINTLHKPHHP